VERHDFDLHEMLDRLLRPHREGAGARGLTVECVYGPGTEVVSADPQQIEQVLLNLIHNALQAMARGGTLTVTTEARDAHVRITFEDTGEGIPEAAMAKIFQPFFTTKHRGSGLGLSIVRKIAEAHGGTVEVRSRPGEGTAATVVIPVREPGR
jgi:signal transduction histidine kinase